MAAERLAYREILHRVDVDGVERYLSSNWQLPDARRGFTRLAGVWRPSWYRQYLKDIGKWRSDVIGLLKVADDLCKRLSITDASPLHDISTTLTTQLDTREVQQLLALATRGSAGAYEAFDQLAREQAKPVLSTIIDCYGVVEAMWSLAVATVEHGWCYPKRGSGLKFSSLIHPFLGQTAVPNDLDLTDHVRVCFVTGPNMGGKSTFLRAVAVAILLAHCGCGVPAASMEFRPVGTIFSSVQIADNLAAGESFYLAEVRRIRALAVALLDNGAAFAVVDEPFRGTNVHDAAEATLAVITRLAAHPGALVFIASHLAEVVPALHDDPRISLLHLQPMSPATSRGLTIGFARASPGSVSA